MSDKIYWICRKCGGKKCHHCNQGWEKCYLPIFLNVSPYPLYFPRVYFGVRKGENNYYETDKYDGNGTAH